MQGPGGVAWEDGGGGDVEHQHGCGVAGAGGGGISVGDRKTLSFTKCLFYWMVLQYNERQTHGLYSCTRFQT